MFDPVDPKQSFPDLERGILQYWKEEDMFKRSKDQRKDGEVFSFYDGPPFATGLPHYGHLLAGTIKDVIPRYQTMKGKYVERRFGWDCHGLPIENLIEKEHDIKDKKQIEEMGVGAFNDLCRASVQRYVKEWRQTVDRTGRWVDMDYDYRTMDAPYMESIWWVFSALWKKGLIYEGKKPMHVCPRCATPLSNFEVNLGYKDVADVAVTAKFKLEDGAYALAWTTTPWTLPGNLLLAVHSKLDYVRFTRKDDDAEYIASNTFFEQLSAREEGLDVVKQLKGKDVVGLTYTPLFPYFADTENAFRVVAADFVTAEDGTGIVHIAPGFGEDDYETGKNEGVPVVQHVTINGQFTKEVTDFAGMTVKSKDDPQGTDRQIAKYLGKQELLFAEDKYKHSYPHCWRCDTPLLNYATSSWFVAIDKIKEDMLAANAQTEWTPAHLRDGRFGEWLRNARDWAISRNRYWGTPLPIWRNEETEDIRIIGSRDELMREMPIRFTKVTAVRHAQSEGNVTKTLQSKEPGTPLTKEGEKQAAAAGKKLSTQQVDIIYCSPLLRTRMTAEAIAKETGAEIVIDDRLRELDFGEYDGRCVHDEVTNLDLARLKRAEKLEKNKPEHFFHMDGMETWASVNERVSAFISEMLPKHRSEHVVVVTHGDPVFSLRHFFTGEDPVKLSHQGYIDYATPETFFWDHARGSSMDLHKDIMDDISWPARSTEQSVELMLVRHGETDWNVEDRLQSQADRELNENGRMQAKELADTLRKGKAFDAIVTSDLKRASQTADILSAELGVPVVGSWPELRERKCGDWEGKTMAELRAEVPGLESASFYAGTPPGGETLDAFIERSEQALEKLLKDYPGKRVLVVCHRGTVRAVKAAAENLSYQDALAIEAENACAEATRADPRMKRIPEVLDCWFESGSMPYAQYHYPFDLAGDDAAFAWTGDETAEASKKYPRPPAFPADFIAEGIDQTRGWFYTLTVLGSALFGISPFQNVIVNGTILAEDGRKMSKSLKNYPDPNEVLEKYGADALRFTLMNSPAVRAMDMRFSEKAVEETIRSVILPLWNSYSFFVTYANGASWEPIPDTHPSHHPLDQYLRAEVQDLVNRMTAQLDKYDLSATCRELFETIDALTNWYIRLSRRRFAGKLDTEASEDLALPVNQEEALHTLYYALIRISQLLAPFCPYVTDSIYQNLVPESHASVHLTDWPTPRELTKEEKSLLDRHRTLRTIVSLGQRLRSSANVKVRTPLGKATIAIPSHLLPSGGLAQEDMRLLMAELNVKHIEVNDDPGSLGRAVAMVDARKVGPRLGKGVQDVIAKGKAGEFTQEDDGTVRIGDAVLTDDEVRIVYQPLEETQEGTVVDAEGGVVMMLDTALSDDLKLEGDARDIIRSVQRLRKESGLLHTDTISLELEGCDDIVEQFRELIERETLSTIGKADGDEHEVLLEGRTVRVKFGKRE